MKPTICLLTPPSVFLLDERVFMTLGILKVAAVLEKAGYSVEMVDLSGIENFLDAARDHAARSNATIFGLTATTPQLPATIRISNAIRSVRPDARLILGGPHVTLVNAARKRELRLGIEGRVRKAFEQLESVFDVLVAGDGEQSIFQAIQDNSPPLIDADDPKSLLFLTSAMVTELPLPARHLVDTNSYRYTIEGVRAMSLIAQLGCPFECGFCGGRDSPMLRRIRTRTSQGVVSEVLHLHENYGVTGFMLYDDELNVNPKMVSLMRMLAHAAQERGVEWRLRGFIKAELFTDEQAAAMYEAGFRWILTGFESGSPRILKNINKKATLEDNTRCIEIAHRRKLKVKALMSIGHPGESPETVEQTYRWLLDVKPDDFDVTIITPYPGTPYYDQAVHHGSAENLWVYTINGDRLYSYDLDYTVISDYYKGDPNGGYKSFVFSDFLSQSDLVNWRHFVETNVRAKLGIPFNVSSPALRYEHSMGQYAEMPSYIVRHSSKSSPLPSVNAAAAGTAFPIFHSGPSQVTRDA